MTKIKHVHFHKMVEAVVRDVKSFRVDKIEPYKAWNWGLQARMSEIGFAVTVESQVRTFYVGRVDYHATSIATRREWPGIYGVLRMWGGHQYLADALRAGKGMVEIEELCRARVDSKDLLQPRPPAS